MPTQPPAAAPRVQASTVRVRATFAEKRFGVAGLQKFRQSASPALRDFLGTTTNPPGGWVPFELFIEANVLCDRLFGRGDLGLVWEIGRFAASHNLGVWKATFMRHSPPSVFVAIARGLWSSHYQGGRLASRATGVTGMAISIIDFPAPHKAHCNSIGGWLQGSLELGPRKDIEVKEVACRTEGAGFCEFRATWT